MELFQLTSKLLIQLALKTSLKRRRKSSKSMLKLNLTKRISFSPSLQANKLVRIFSNVLNFSSFCSRWRKVNKSQRSPKKILSQLLSQVQPIQKRTCNQTNGSKHSVLFSTLPNSRIKILYQPQNESKASFRKLLLKFTFILHLLLFLTR